MNSLKRFVPQIVRPGAGVSGFLHMGFETFVVTYEAHFVWGTQDAGADRYVELHLGVISLSWHWAVRS